MTKHISIPIIHQVEGDLIYGLFPTNSHIMMYYQSAGDLIMFSKVQTPKEHKTQEKKDQKT